MKLAQALLKVTSLLEADSTPHLFVMIGVPGVGKSTFIGQLLPKVSFRPFTVASTDDLIEAEALKRGKTYSQVFKDLNFKHLNKQMMKTVEDSVHAGVSIIVDRTNMSRKSRSTFIDTAPQYVKVALNFTVDDKILTERLRIRAEKTGKFIPPFVVKSMFDNYNAPTKDEGFHHLIEIDNS